MNETTQRRTSVPGETTTHVRIHDDLRGDRSVVVNVMDREAIRDYFADTADEHVRIMVLVPPRDERDGDGSGLYVTIDQDGGIVVSTEGDVSMD